ncbi:hypothetical protein ES332_A12G083300v1 [Gossypium tomentosum]|uniref:RRM domain-containing protein n=2 Tax=Gossypium TaxID=3633 RepID=A0A5D2MU06_GOSTO|nr:hypothetical protein ES332_A12G083300v1 [Gossypium tomentosum]
MRGQVTLFVSNIPETMHWKGLWALFNYHGEVKDAFIPIKKNKDGKMFGFVRYSNDTDAQRAIVRLNGFVLLGYRIRVKMASFRGNRKSWKIRSTNANVLRNKDQNGFEKDRNDIGKGDSFACSKKDLIKERNCSGEDGNQVRRVKGFVDEECPNSGYYKEQLWKLQRCLVGKVVTVCDLRSLAERLAKFGFGELIVKRIQGRFFLIEVPDEEYMEVLKQNDWAYLKECFITIEPWSDKRFVTEMVTWIEVAVEELWGKLISVGDSWNGSKGYEKMEMLITINQPKQIKELIMMEIGNCIFPIRIENSLNVMNTTEEDGGESPEVESRNRSESECCPEGRRNDVGGDINAISLEDGVMDKGDMRFSAENQMSEENFLGNNKSVSGEGVGSGLEMDRDREYLINMGFNSLVGPSEVSGDHNYVDQLTGSLGENGLIVGRGSIPVEYVEDEIVRFNFGEEFVQLSQSRRKKKSLNKKIRSMRDIQNGVLSTREKQKRDRKEKLEKGKAVARCEDSTVNLSLSDSDINNRRRVILREAKRTWKVGKKVGLSVRGNEEEVIEEIGRLEGQGLGSEVKKASVNRNCRLARANVCFLQETKLELINIDVVRKLWGDDNCEFRFVAAKGRSGGLLTMWNKDEFLFSKEWSDGRVLVIEGRWIKEDLEVVLINIYAPNLASEQKVLWAVLMELRFQFASPWIMGGDFNVVRSRSERSRCVGSEKGSKEFDNFIQNCKLIDLPLVGKKFTWYGPDNKKSRLDRFLVEEHWLIKIKDLQQMGLKRSVSDYIPILLADAEIDWGPRPFKFINGWLRNKECASLIEEKWSIMGSLNG